MKFYCKNCKWQSSWFWRIIFLFQPWYRNCTVYEKYCVNPELIVFCKVGNKENTCKYYKCIWWKFWVDEREILEKVKDGEMVSVHVKGL